MNKKNKIVFLVLGIFVLIVLILFFPLKNIFTGNAISLNDPNNIGIPEEPNDTITPVKKEVVTGEFEMMPSKPYFVSYREDAPEYTQLTYFGDIPEHAVFEFKVLSNCVGLESCKENYIILPLDTNIKTAKDLCQTKADDGLDLMGLNSGEIIRLWDSINQRIIDLTKCSNRMQNIELYPMQVYLITVSRNVNWTQK